MIRFIAGIDEKRGLATDDGIPWHLPSDIEFYREQTTTGLILMGMNTYREFRQPMHAATHYVATRHAGSLRPGFVAVHDVPRFFDEHRGELINDIGGAQLFASTLGFADELVITQIRADFHCTKFFPAYERDFLLAETGDPITENGVTFCFQNWRRR